MDGALFRQDAIKQKFHHCDVAAHCHLEGLAEQFLALLRSQTVREERCLVFCTGLPPRVAYREWTSTHLFAIFHSGTPSLLLTPFHRYNITSCLAIARAFADGRASC